MIRSPMVRVFVAVALLSSPSPVFAGGYSGVMGPTGISGSVSGKSIKVSGVAKGSPADGKIKKNDVIIGVGDDPFTGDPRRALAEAIDEAETVAAGGRLTLMLKGNRKVVLTLRVLGSYSQTAPYDCPKTDKIITQIAENLLKSGGAGSGATRAGMLGLMATGEKKYIDAVGRIIKAEKGDFAKAIKSGGKPMQGRIYSIWHWSYSTIALSEYYLLTKDKSLLPGIRSLALTLALSQDAGGLWGHSPVNPSTGRLHGYAQMNQPSLAAFMGMLLAHECGVKDPVLDKAIARSYAYFENYIGRGTFSYGVGSGSTRGFNNNGMSGSAAICMALKGNSNGARFFSQMAATSYDDLEGGHASYVFNPLWTGLGAHISGPEVTKQYFRKSLWFHNIRRGWDGGYGRVDPRRGDMGHGVALLNYCLPRRKLLITGREADRSIWLNRTEATKVIMMSRLDYASAGNEELIARYTITPFPHIRRRASWSLLKERTEEQLEALKPIWASYLKTGTDKQKQLALSMYGGHTPLEAKRHWLETIGVIARSGKESLKVRVSAMQSLGSFKELARPYYMDIVKLIAEDRPDDPFGDVDVGLGRSLHGISRTPFGDGLVTDKEMFYAVANKIMSCKRDKVMVEGVKMLADMPLEDFYRVGDNVLRIAKNQDRSLHHYHPLHAVQESIRLLSRLGIKEGMDCIQNGFRGGRFNNEAKMIVNMLPTYGGNAKKAAAALIAKTPQLGQGRLGKYWQRAIKTIEDDKSPRRLITFEEAMRAGRR